MVPDGLLLGFTRNSPEYTCQEQSMAQSCSLQDTQQPPSGHSPPQAGPPPQVHKSPSPGLVERQAGLYLGLRTWPVFLPWHISQGSHGPILGKLQLGASLSVCVSRHCICGGGARFPPLSFLMSEPRLPRAGPVTSAEHKAL